MSTLAPINKRDTIKAWLAFACVAFFWGTTFLAIKIGVKTYPPFLFSGMRQMAAGIILAAPFLLKRSNWPDKAQLKKSLIAGTLMIVVGNGAVTWAEKYVSSGLAAILCSFTPFWIVGINFMSDKTEKVTKRVLLGMCIALAGIIFIFFDNLKDLSNPAYVLGIVAVLVANASWGAGTVYTKKNKSSLSPLYAAGLQLFTAGVILNLISLCFETPYHLTFETDGLLALLYLITFGSVVAFGAYLYAIAALPTAIVGTYAYINPVVAVMLGWLFLNESLNMFIGIGFLMVLTGVYLVNTLSQKQRRVMVTPVEAEG